uniref:Putative secreted protein n=1 Tax=Ixodes ricinus TaxID=34613 RepID=A0A6B0TU88_IXORI
MAMSPDSSSFWILAAMSGFLRCSWSALGSLCICSKMILMAGSPRIFWTSGSAMARFRTSSGSAVEAIRQRL